MCREADDRSPRQPVFPSPGVHEEHLAAVLSDRPPVLLAAFSTCGRARQRVLVSSCRVRLMALRCSVRSVRTNTFRSCMRASRIPAEMAAVYRRTPHQLAQPLWPNGVVPELALKTPQKLEKALLL